MLALVALFGGCRGYSIGKRFDLWRKKLRLTVPSSYQPAGFDQLVNLKPGCPFDEREIEAIDRLEGRAVMLEGYLVRVEQLADGKTYFGLLRRGDIHLEIGDGPDFSPAGDARLRIICEITVPFQLTRRHWNLRGLAPLAGLVRDDLTAHSYPGGTPGGARVRLSGYLLDDFIHCLAVGRTRATAWEIHPVTRVEVYDAAAAHFVPLK